MFALCELHTHTRIAWQIATPDCSYLFGSVASSESARTRTKDLLVVFPDDAPPERRRNRLAYEVLRGTGTAADVFVCPRSYFEDWRP